MRVVASRMTLSQRRHAAHALRPRLRLDQWHVWSNVPARTRTRLDSWCTTSLVRYVHEYHDTYFRHIAAGPYDYAIGLSDRGAAGVSYVTQQMFETGFGGEIGYLAWKVGVSSSWVARVRTYSATGIVVRWMVASRPHAFRSGQID